MLIHIVVTLAMTVSTCFAQEAKVEKKRPPNIILIMADDIGVECFGRYGGTSYKTPVIDGLAKKGMRFTHCYPQPFRPGSGRWQRQGQA